MDTLNISVEQLTSYGNNTIHKPPRYRSDPFGHQLPVPFLPQMDQTDFLSLWAFYTTVLRKKHSNVLKPASS